MSLDHQCILSKRASYFLYLFFSIFDHFSAPHLRIPICFLVVIFILISWNFFVQLLKSSFLLRGPVLKTPFSGHLNFLPYTNTKENLPGAILCTIYSQNTIKSVTLLQVIREQSNEMFFPALFLVE